ncbi:MAG TPA: hypothetical protein PL005_04640, partial [Candidatus Hydrogenedentes bacterium]|nr:hypothetical protein [Candidatus Hydrogenedentota bacterium]
MELQFDKSEIPELAAEYDKITEKERRLTDKIEKSVFRDYKSKGFLTKEQFLTVCAWKTPRTKKHCRSNDAALIRQVSAIARKTRSEEMRIQIWTLLAGVSWPTASVFLHFAFPEKYPILDFRAL